MRRGLIPSTQEIFGDLALEVNPFFRKMSKNLEAPLEPLEPLEAATPSTAAGRARASRSPSTAAGRPRESEAAPRAHVRESALEVRASRRARLE